MNSRTSTCAPVFAGLLSLLLAGCANVYDALEQRHFELCRARPSPACFGDGYLRAGARVLDDPYFGQPPRAPSDLGEPAPES